MNKLGGCGVFALLFWGLSGEAAAEPVVLGTAAEHLDLVPAEFAPIGRLIGGAVSTGVYSGVFYTKQGSSRCTGTVISDRVVATAAHCVSNGGSLTLEYKSVTYKGTCTRSAKYSNNSTADWALCLLSKPIPDAIAESVLDDGSVLDIGGEITLMGYGCTKAGATGGNDGKLRVGKAEISGTPSGSDYDVVTDSGASICEGDSGGPSFYTDPESGRRYQLGINSRRSGDFKTSYLSSLFVSPAQAFYLDWAEKKSVKICGLHDDATGCAQTP
jgi:hypothetical protein